MFLVFNKSKIVSYLISVGTVAVLFVMAFYITNNNGETIQTSANNVIENKIEENINILNNKSMINNKK